ncbi:putative thioredoxin peroxidase [Dictyocoela muelleri]|nr:putative thioredoxin peroxidase [Dictyocoela muelleri]
MMIDTQIENRELTACVRGEIAKVKLHDYKGKTLVIIFYPYDFTTICPTEINAFSYLKAEFDKLNAAILFCSTDSVYSHIAWTKKDDLECIKSVYPIISDFDKEFSRSLGLLEKEGNSMRATVIIDSNLKIRHISMNSKDIGRSTEEVLRLVKAINHNIATGEMILVDRKF